MSADRACCACLHVERRCSEIGGYVTSEWWACRDCGRRFEFARPPFLDFTFFWCQIAIAMIATRLQLVYGIAKDEKFARELFKCYSNTTRLKVIVRVIEAPEIEVV